MSNPTKHGNVLSWASDIEANTIEQAQRTANLPFIDGHVALMPDAHLGYGSTVGSVIPTRGAIIPAAVGVDIGCGMIAVETPLTSTTLPDNLDELHNRITRAVPAGVGKGHQTDARTRGGKTDLGKFFDRIPDGGDLDRAVKQMGSLGSGNHFVEVCLDERDVVWVVLHSGSRGIGKMIADIHIAEAKGLMARYFIDLPDPDLAYLVEGTPEFDAYIKAMQWAQDYAMTNRDLMMDAVMAELRTAVRPNHDGSSWFDEVARINCHHNYTARENHKGHNVWVTRKGAIRAREGDRGVIPGSMGTRSYIVSGLGNASSYHSCSHGAGRRMSRSAARRELDVAGLVTSMDGKAWDSTKAETLIDEDPRSYKDIDVVMEDQADLVSIDHTLSQILNYKGT